MSSLNSLPSTVKCQIGEQGHILSGGPVDSVLGLPIEGTRVSWAAFNPEHTRRYVLTRLWGPAPPMLFGMCNASRADGTTDDATVRKCIGFARRADCGGVVVVNAASLIATDPLKLLGPDVPCDGMNKQILELVISGFAGPVVAAWGAWPTRIYRRILPGIVLIRRLANPLLCYGTTKSGHPHHPSRIAYSTPLVPLVPLVKG